MTTEKIEHLSLAKKALEMDLLRDPFGKYHHLSLDQIRAILFSISEFFNDRFLELPNPKEARHLIRGLHYGLFNLSYMPDATRCVVERNMLKNLAYSESEQHIATGYLSRIHFAFLEITKASKAKLFYLPGFGTFVRTKFPEYFVLIPDCSSENPTDKIRKCFGVSSITNKEELLEIGETVFRAAIHTFGGVEVAREWLETKNDAFGGVTPLEEVGWPCFGTEIPSGIQNVLSFLSRIKIGFDSDFEKAGFKKMLVEKVGDTFGPNIEPGKVDRIINTCSLPRVSTKKTVLEVAMTFEGFSEVMDELGRIDYGILC